MPIINPDIEVPEGEYCSQNGNECSSLVDFERGTHCGVFRKDLESTTCHLYEIIFPENRKVSKCQKCLDECKKELINADNIPQSP
jgi:hypothetical protein